MVMYHLSQTGSSSASANTTIHNMFNLPQFKYNLLSVSEATRQLNCSASFFPYIRIFQDLYNGKVNEIGKERVILYYLLRHSKLPAHRKNASGLSVQNF